MLDREKVGRAILEQRKIKGMTQKQLADLLNVSYQAVSRWKQGISLPSVDMIYDIAHILETTVDFLLNGPLEERKVISYMDTGLDIKKLHMMKDRLSSLVTKDDMLLHTKDVGPVFFCQIPQEWRSQYVCLQTMFLVLRNALQWKMDMTERYVLIWYRVRLII